MKTNEQIKTDATRYEYSRVFGLMNTPRHIYAECSDGIWERRVWQVVGRFGWSKWKKI